MMVFLKEFAEKVGFEKNPHMTKKHAKLPSRQRVNVNAFFFITFLKILWKKEHLLYKSKYSIFHHIFKVFKT